MIFHKKQERKTDGLSRVAILGKEQTARIAEPERRSLFFLLNIIM
jgi:hypothetical protein